MHRTVTFTRMAGAVMAAGLLAPPTAAGAGGDSHVVVRTYDRTAVAPADRTAALAVATKILEDAGLEIAWLACEAALAPGGTHPCLTALEANELAVRLVRRPPPSGARQMALGYSLVETEVPFGSLATIYVDRVATMAAASTVDPPTLLGRAIAHEVGHLLLATAAHARTGVMRASWSPHAIRRDRPGDWSFTATEAQALRHAVRRRTARQVQTW